MKQSDSIKTIAPALLKAQQLIGSAIKDSKNPFFKSCLLQEPHNILIMQTMRLSLEGRKFGKLTVVASSHRNNRKSWICKCECGKETNVITQNLTHNYSKSCGKCETEFYRKFKKEYLIWQSMKQRCLNPEHKFYRSYGARGITISQEWLDFKTFINDMGSKPVGKSLDRIDNNDGYSKNNCRWATQIEQKNNCRNNRLLTKDGETLTMAQWARKIGVNYRTLKSRVNKGKSVEEVIR